MIKYQRTMHCYFCHIAKGTIYYVEHKSGRWLTKSELDSVEWLPADLDVVERLKAVM